MRSALAMTCAAGIAVCIVASRAPSQVIPDSLTSPPATGTWVQAQKEGKKRLAEGKPAEAVPHLMRALEQRPFDREILADLIRASVKDPEAKALWIYTYALAAVTADGRVPVDSDLQKSLSKDDKFLLELAEKRAEAIVEVAKLAKSLKAKPGPRAGNTPIGAHYAGRLFWELARSSPLALATQASGMQSVLSVYVPDPKPITNALDNIVVNGLSKPTMDEAVRAALIMTGLAAQAGFGKDLRGPKAPDMKSVGERGRNGLNQARTKIAIAQGEPLTVEMLANMTDEDRAAFTKAHDRFTNPGLAVTPEGKYRVETICGFESLLGAAETLDLHHKRLANWYGVDPFVGRQGTVRIVPENSGLESEGSPFWWAGGFQSGDVTTLHFAIGSIEGMGHGLTHELTHRFDGTIFPFMPAWMAEGRAVWTAAAYARAEQESFVENHVSFGTVESCIYKGYTGLENIGKLIDGTPDDYRDNYTAGYALWVYLNTWVQDGKPLFKPHLSDYMKGFPKGRTKPRAWFEANFCDGKDGRPKTFEDFAKMFAEFVNGFYWRNRAAWTSRYTQDAGDRKNFEWVYDLPTWKPSRARAEPWFGQDQARLAAELLTEVGKKNEALMAWAWAAEVDEWTPGIVEPFAKALGDARLDDLVYALRGVDAVRRCDAKPLDTKPPFSGELTKTMQLLDAYAAAIETVKARGQDLAAAALAADHDRLAAFVGQPAKSRIDPALGEKSSGLPVDETPRPIGLFGYEEDGLTDYEEKRVKGLWFVEEDGDLNVGRDKPREGTGTVDRGAWQRHAFTRTKEWHAPGRYLVRSRIAFTSSVVSGAIVVGIERADRVVRFHFNGGDFAYSVGLKEEAAKFDSIGWRFSGRRGRDGGLSQSPGGNTKFKGEKSSFVVELLVDGPEVHAFVEGDWVGSYHEIEGRNIEGFVGFALDEGAILVSEATVQRLDRSRSFGMYERWPAPLDLSRDDDLDGERYKNRRLVGVPPTKDGTLVVWVNAETPEAFEAQRSAILSQARNMAMNARAMLDQSAMPQRLVVALPEMFGAEAITAMTQDLVGDDPTRIGVVVHRRKKALLSNGVPNRPADPLPSLILVDPWGVIRELGDYLPFDRRLPAWLLHHLTVLRGRA